MERTKSSVDGGLNASLDAYLKSVTLEHSDEYWDKVNKNIANNQKTNDELNDLFRPNQKLMCTVFDI